MTSDLALRCAHCGIAHPAAAVHRATAFVRAFGVLLVAVSVVVVWLLHR